MLMCVLVKNIVDPPHMKRGTSCYEGLIKAEHEMFYELGYYR